MQVWGKFQVLQNCCYCCFQHQPKFNFSSVTNCSGSVGISGVRFLSHLAHTSPATSLCPTPVLGFVTQHCPKMVPTGHGHPETQLSTFPFSGIYSKSTEFLLEVETALTVAFGFPATSSRQHGYSGSRSQLIH